MSGHDKADLPSRPSAAHHTVDGVRVVALHARSTTPAETSCATP
ncbi:MULTISPECIES: hypothetical protein [unclassified Streptomyces]